MAEANKAYAKHRFKNQTDFLCLYCAGTNAGDLTTLQQANLVLVALVQMLLPKEVEENEDEGSGAADDSSADLEALAAVARNTDLAGKLEGSAPPEDGFSAVARLAWGVLLANHAPANFRGEPTHASIST